MYSPSCVVKPNIGGWEITKTSYGNLTIRHFEDALATNTDRSHYRRKFKSTRETANPGRVFKDPLITCYSQTIIIVFQMEQSDIYSKARRPCEIFKTVCKNILRVA